ncbi:MAG: hypothetical protein AB7G17_10025 [Phycisphaerales bacterium]
MRLNGWLAGVIGGAALLCAPAMADGLRVSVRIGNSACAPRPAYSHGGYGGHHARPSYGHHRPSYGHHGSHGRPHYGGHSSYGAGTSVGFYAGSSGRHGVTTYWSSSYSPSYTSSYSVRYSAPAPSVRTHYPSRATYSTYRPAHVEYRQARSVRYERDCAPRRVYYSRPACR